MHPTGVEPVTFGSVDRCSIQLSYGCLIQIIFHGIVLSTSLGEPLKTGDSWEMLTCLDLMGDTDCFGVW